MNVLTYTINSNDIIRVEYILDSKTLDVYFTDNNISHYKPIPEDLVHNMNLSPESAFQMLEDYVNANKEVSAIDLGPQVEPDSEEDIDIV